MFNISIKKNGGMWFWNVGRIGGTFYVSSKSAFAARQHKKASIELIKASVAVEKQWWPYGWTEDGFQRHMDFVAEQAILREIIYT